MATIAMAAGMVSIAMGRAGAPSFHASMAFVVIGDLITSTLFSLMVIPVFHSYIDDLAVGKVSSPWPHASQTNRPCMGSQ